MSMTDFAECGCMERQDHLIKVELLKDEIMRLTRIGAAAPIIQDAKKQLEFWEGVVACDTLVVDVGVMP